MGRNEEATIERSDSIANPDAARRAALDERYEQERRRAIEPETNDAEQRTGIFANDPTATITGIEADIDDEAEAMTLLALQNRIKDVTKVRFTLDTDERTKWYEWHPDDPDHQLTHIIHYYGDGAPSSLVGKNVHVAHIHDDPHIVIPAPYRNKIAHLVYPLYRKAYELNQPDEGTYYGSTVVKNHDDDAPVTPDIWMKNILGTQGARVLGTVLSVVVFLIPAVVRILSGNIQLAAAVFLFLTSATLSGRWFIYKGGEYTRGLLTGVPRLIISAVRRPVAYLRSLNEVDPIEN